MHICALFIKKKKSFPPLRANFCPFGGMLLPLLSSISSSQWGLALIIEFIPDSLLHCEFSSGYSSLVTTSPKTQWYKTTISYPHKTCELTNLNGHRGRPCSAPHCLGPPLGNSKPGAGISRKLLCSHTWQSMSGAGWSYRPECLLVASWTSLRHGGWVSKASNPGERVFFLWPSPEVPHHLSHSTLCWHDHKTTLSWQGGTDSTSRDK